MKRTIPLLIMFFSGVLLMLGSFIPYTQSWKEDVAVWFDILAAIAFILGGGNLLKMHLKKISNWQAGWGYSAVTLLAFTITLIVGMLKFGVPPAVQAEQYGAIAVPLPLSAFPQVTTVDGQLPHGEFPPSVKHQLTADSATETVSFRGWLTESQRLQLKDFEREAGWHKTVDELFAKAQPPQEVRDRVGYHAVLETLHFAGVMTDAGRNAMLGLSDDPRWLTAVEEIDKQSHRAHSVPLKQLPEGISVPDELEQVVKFDPVKRELRMIGPMSPKQRGVLANQFPAGTALTQQQKEQLREKLEEFGTLSSIQVERLNEFDDEKPTTGQRNKKLMFALLQPAVGGAAQQLNEAQRNLLLEEYNREVTWRANVEELYETSHDVKHAWSGTYDAGGSALWYVYEYGLWPLTSTMFALLAFYVASAAFRAFRAKNFEATLLLATAFIILLGRTYAGTFLTGWMPDYLSGLTIPGLSMTIMSVFTTAGNRAIMIGIALGIASTSLKVLLGVDRSYLGSDRK